MTPDILPAPLPPALDASAIPTLAALHDARLRASPQATACRHFDTRTQRWESTSWNELAVLTQDYVGSLAAQGLREGDVIALMLGAGPDWLALDWAAQRLGLVCVSLFPDETAAGAIALLEDCDARLLVTGDGAAWTALGAQTQLPALRAVIALHGAVPGQDRRVQSREAFLKSALLRTAPASADGARLASIVYTSGATGRPRGVMLSHASLLANAFACASALDLRTDDEMFCVLPLAHLYGRVAAVYASLVCGASLVFGRGPAQVGEDLLSQRPTVLVGVPRLFERLHGALEQELLVGPLMRRALFRLAVDVGHAAQRKDASRLALGLLPTSLTRKAGELLRSRLGGRLRLAVSGGASLAPQIGRSFAALGIPLLQGYGLTEAGPVVSVNRVHDNDPASVGLPLEGVETRIEASGELLVRGPGVMLGYWKDEAATRAALDSAGWLRTGDKVSRLDTQRIYLVGRFKELLVTATGEKASPGDIEARLRALPLVDQVMVVGEARPYLTALILPQPGPLALLRAELGLNEGDDSPAALQAIEDAVLRRCQATLVDAPRNHWLLRVALVQQPWTPANGLLTATHKLRRCEIARTHARDIARLYEGHYLVPATDCSQNATL